MIRTEDSFKAVIQRLAGDINVLALTMMHIATGCQFAGIKPKRKSGQPGVDYAREFYQGLIELSDAGVAGFSGSYQEAVSMIEPYIDADARRCSHPALVSLIHTILTGQSVAEVTDERFQGPTLEGWRKLRWRAEGKDPYPFPNKRLH